MQITIELPGYISLTEADLRLELAIALFQQDRISICSASKIAGMHVIDFQKLISYDVEEFQQDVQHLRDRGWL